MKSQGHSLLVFFQHSFITEREEERFQQLVHTVETPEEFCLAHELVDRNRITPDKRKIIKESSREELRPFRFLLNKN
jgi:hypothetical protein